MILEFDEQNKCYVVRKFDFTDVKKLSELRFTSKDLSQDELKKFAEFTVNRLKTHPEVLQILKVLLSKKPEMPFTIQFCKETEHFANSDLNKQLISINTNQSDTQLLEGLVFGLCNLNDEILTKIQQTPLKEFKDEVDYATQAVEAQIHMTQRYQELLILAFNNKYKGWGDHLPHNPYRQVETSDQLLLLAKERDFKRKGFSVFTAFQHLYWVKLVCILREELLEISDAKIRALEILERRQRAQENQTAQAQTAQEQAQAQTAQTQTEQAQTAQPQTQEQAKPNVDLQVMLKTLEAEQAALNEKCRILKEKIEAMEKEAALFMKEQGPQISNQLSYYECVNQILIFYTALREARWSNAEQCQHKYQDRLDSIETRLPTDLPLPSTGDPKKYEEMRKGVLVVKAELTQLTEEMQAFVASTTAANGAGGIQTAATPAPLLHAYAPSPVQSPAAGTEQPTKSQP